MGIITVIAANPVYATLALAVVSVMLAVIILLDVRLAVLETSPETGGAVETGQKTQCHHCLLSRRRLSRQTTVSSADSQSSPQYPSRLPSLSALAYTRRPSSTLRPR